MKALRPLSWLYRGGVAVRNHYFDSVDARKLPVPVVSVGNVTVGGSGKTPLVATIARELLGRGRPVAVVSRGYGRDGASPFVLVSDGSEVLVDARAGGDEPVELARAVEGLVVAVGADRFRVATTLIEKLGRHVIVLDDGFQHRRLARDVDIVCFDCSESAESLELLPAGRLREPLKNTRRADVVVLTQWSEAARVPDFGPVPTIRARTKIVGFTRLDGDETTISDAAAFHGQRVALASGIARPERIRDGLDADVFHVVSRPDHHRWSDAEVEAMLADARGRGARALLTTGKDAVKMSIPAAAVVPVYRIDVETEVLDLELLRSYTAFPPL